MIGKPKFKAGDKVTFECGGNNLTGVVYIADEYGVFEDNTDVHYDIMVEDSPHGNCLYKHVREDWCEKVINLK